MRQTEAEGFSWDEPLKVDRNLARELDRLLGFIGTLDAGRGFSCRELAELHFRLDSLALMCRSEVRGHLYL